MKEKENCVKIVTGLNFLCLSKSIRCTHIRCTRPFFPIAITNTRIVYCRRLWPWLPVKLTIPGANLRQIICSL